MSNVTNTDKSEFEYVDKDEAERVRFQLGSRNIEFAVVKKRRGKN